MKTMAEVLAEHQDYVNDDDSDGVLCAGCFRRIEQNEDSHAGILAGLAAHQADALAAAGYGPVREAAAAGVRSVVDIWAGGGRATVRMGELMEAGQTVLDGEWDNHIKWNLQDITRERARAARQEAAS